MARHGYRIDGLRVAQARQRIQVAGKPITQAAFAERVGIHWVTMNRIENGKANASLELIERIAEETATTREYLLGEDEEEEAAPMAPPTDLFADAVERLRVAAA